ncbi:MAG: hypothetical protein NC254_08005 [bacterium]|nr:hypothetical protein [bacterium]
MLTSDAKKGAMVFLLVMASPEIMMSVGYAGQDEIVYICLFVAALDCFFEDKWKQGYLFIVLCVTCCPIMLMPCLVLIIIKEKRILRILGYAAGSMMPLIVFEWFYRRDAIYQAVKTDNDFLEMTYSMLSATEVDTGMGSVFGSAILLIVVYFLCYGIKKEDDEKFDQNVIYMVAVSFCIICFLMPHYFYRMFLYVPFVAILLFVSDQNINMNLLLITIVTYGRTLQACWISFPQNLETMYVMQDSWITRLCDVVGSGKYKQENSECLWAYLTNFFGGRASLIVTFSKQMIATCTLAAILLLLAINHPRQRKCRSLICPSYLSLIVYVVCMPLFLAMFFVVLLQSA